MALNIITWFWGNKYDATYVAKVYDGLVRSLSGSPFCFRVMADDQLLLAKQLRGCMPAFGLCKICIHQIPLPLMVYTKVKGCFVRLVMFDPGWQKSVGIEPGDTVVSLDLDVIITGDLSPLFVEDADFRILLGANTSNPCPYNGSIWMLKAGYRPDVWNTFSLEAAQLIPRHQFPDDQGWLWYKLPNSQGWQVGKQSGVYAFLKPGWPVGMGLPEGARLVCFPGARDPKLYSNLPWVRRYWSMDNPMAYQNPVHDRVHGKMLEMGAGNETQ